MKEFIFCLLITFFVFNCSSVDDPLSQEQYISFTLIYKDSVETLKIIDKSFTPIDGATYFNTNDAKYTSIRLHDQTENEPYFLSLTFPGDTAGIYDWTIPWNSILIQKNKDVRAPILIIINGQTNITTYGSIGDRVEGNFNGVVRNLSSADTINIHGDFSVQRVNDYNSDL